MNYFFLHSQPSERLGFLNSVAILSPDPTVASDCMLKLICRYALSEFFQPYSLDITCNERWAEAMTPRTAIGGGGGQISFSIDPGYLPLNNPTGDGYVCVYVERGLKHYTHGPYVVTPNQSKCKFVVMDYGYVEQACEA